ncbi:MAG: hypothetical protein HFH27_12695 [Clostridiaceae bacterium]|nr:hypothetical protein [Clostridiaceae bacterium]
MRILFYELRKIWRLQVVAALLLLGAVQYYFFMDFSIRFFPNGHPAAERYTLCREWTEKYGSYMEPDEYADAQEGYAALLADADARIASDPRYAAQGIASWEQFCAVALDAPDADPFGRYRSLYGPLFSSESDWLGYRVECLRGALSAYETRAACLDAAPGTLTPAEQARYNELAAGVQLNGIFPGECIDNLSEYLCWAWIFGVLSVAILLAPGGAREHLSRMTGGLWTTRIGRGTVFWQLGAALLSAGGLFLLEVLAFGGIYAQLGTSFFWDSPTQTFLAGNLFWFDLTYGQYVLCSLGMLLALMLGTAGAIFALSHTSDSYISAVIKALPVSVGMFFTCAAAIQRPFIDQNSLYMHTRVVGIEAALCALVLAGGLAAGLLAALRCQRKELL